MDRLHSQETDRNFISVNHSMPMNENEISQTIQEHMNRTNNDMQFTMNNTSFSNDVPHPSSINRVSNASNITLESRLSALINPKARNSAYSGLIVFKKHNKEYEKRSTQLVFDELKLNKSARDNKSNQSRNMSFNTLRSESSFIQGDNKKRKDKISKFENEI